METTISIHAPRAGSDLTGMSDPEKWIRFQSTLPVRGATSFSRAAFAGSCYFNPRSPCGERRGAGRRIRGNRLISIHAPRAGSDIQKLAFLSDSLGFQSTLPVRGATQRQKNRWELFYISIHAPRAGSDDEPRAGRGVPRDFNPRSPCGERREFGQYATAASQQISIHAPRAGSDGEKAKPFGGALYFNPRSPCGERRNGADIYTAPRQNFNPRSPCGERRYRAKVTVGKDIFQSTLPVRGATRRCTKKQCIASKFQSTLPVRGATMDRRGAACISGISIHAPRAGSDFYGRRRGCDPLNFNPRSPCGERLGGDSVVQREGDFNPRSPCGERR